MNQTPTKAPQPAVGPCGDFANLPTWIVHRWLVESGSGRAAMVRELALKEGVPAKQQARNLHNLVRHHIRYGTPSALAMDLSMIMLDTVDWPALVTALADEKESETNQ